MARKRVLIAGAAGRDFHNFNLVYRHREDVEVIAFTATQIPNVDGRVYPAELAGPLYPLGIPILPESSLELVVRDDAIDEVVFAYSDVTHEHVMHVASRVLAAGASHRLLSPRETMLASEKPVAEGNLVFAGVDYAALLDAAEREADVILWDGGNNDTPFLEPTLHIVVVDPHRPGHELRYHPGETNLRLADVCVVNKVDSAAQAGIDAVLESIQRVNPKAAVLLAASPFHVEADGEALRCNRVLAIEDGPTLT